MSQQSRHESRYVNLMTGKVGNISELIHMTLELTMRLLLQVDEKCDSLHSPLHFLP